MRKWLKFQKMDSDLICYINLSFAKFLYISSFTNFDKTNPNGSNPIEYYISLFIDDIEYVSVIDFQSEIEANMWISVELNN